MHQFKLIPSKKAIKGRFYVFSWVFYIFTLPQEIYKLILNIGCLLFLGKMASTSVQTTQDLLTNVEQSFQSLTENYKQSEKAIMKRFTETGKAFEAVENALQDLMDHSGVNDQYSEVGEGSEAE